jgi:CubicO group peptidase (beta-lactamase class C family)
MRNIILAIAAISILACEHDSPKSPLEQKILEVENGLRADVEVEGQEVTYYNIEDRMKELNIPGLSIAVLRDGEIEWAKAYGLADVTEGRKMTTETMLLAASISKPVSATRVHQLVEEGIVHLDSNINNYLSSWKLPDNKFTVTEKVTPGRILSHTAGLTVWGFPGYDKGDYIPTIQEILDGQGNTDSVRVYKVPGESWQYSGGGYTILQLMITDLEKRSYPDLMQEKVLDPLGMTQSTYANPLPEEYHGIAATGYRNDRKEVEGKWPIYPEMAAAGLWTTPSQLILWSKEMQKIYQSQTDGLLQAETVNEMVTPGLNNSGLGPMTDEYRFGHDGADEGFRCRMMAWKDTSVAFVVMINSDNFDIIPEITMSITQAYNLPGNDPYVKSIQHMNEAQLKRFEGTYTFSDFGDSYLEAKDGGLEVTAEFFDYSYMIYPENDSTFFLMEDGQSYNFRLNDNEVKGYVVDGYVAEKTK